VAQKLKALLVCNTTLAHLCEAYGLMDELVAAPAAKVTIMHQTSSKAGMFEAHIAGVYYSILKEAQSVEGPNDSTTSGTADSREKAAPAGVAFEAIRVWLYDLFKPIAKWAFDEMKAAQVQSVQGLSPPSNVMIPTKADYDDTFGESELGGADFDLDSLARGSCMLLNQYCIARLGGMPGYDESGPALGPHTVVCSVVDDEGRLR
jgi:hypothetical protein